MDERKRSVILTIKSGQYDKTGGCGIQGDWS
jgi:hypothetical protein